MIINGSPAEPVAVEDDDDGAIKPLSERLLSELSTYRTLALRDAIANNPDVAATAVLHALCLATFYRGSFSTCLNISAESRTFLAEAPDLAQSQPARAIAARTTHWKQLLPDDPQDLWHVLGTFDAGQRAALLAHCVSQTADALHDPWRGTPGRLTHADTLARDLGLDIAATGWTATAANYLERVPKPRILEAVQEAKGDSFVQLIAHMKKSDMAREAQRMLDGTGWLPEPLRTQDLDGSTNPEDEPGVQQEVTLPDFLSGNSADEAADPEDVYAP